MNLQKQAGSCRYGKPLTSFCSWYFVCFFPQGEMALNVPFIKNTLAAVLRIDERGATLVQGDSIMHAMSSSLYSCTVSHLTFKLPPLGHSLHTCRLCCFFILRAFCIYQSCTVYYLYHSDFVPCLNPPPHRLGMA